MSNASPMRLVYSASAQRQHYVFHLYVAGMSAHSIRATECVKRLCEERLQGRVQLKIVDLLLQPSLAKEENVIAVPTLIRMFPLPVRRMIGDLSDVSGLLQEVDCHWEDTL